MKTISNLMRWKHQCNREDLAEALAPFGVMIEDDPGVLPDLYAFVFSQLPIPDLDHNELRGLQHIWRVGSLSECTTAVRMSLREKACLVREGSGIHTKHFISPLGFAAMRKKGLQC